MSDGVTIDTRVIDDVDVDRDSESIKELRLLVREEERCDTTIEGCVGGGGGGGMVTPFWVRDGRDIWGLTAGGWWIGTVAGFRNGTVFNAAFLAASASSSRF